MIAATKDFIVTIHKAVVSQSMWLMYFKPFHSLLCMYLIVLDLGILQVVCNEKFCQRHEYCPSFREILSASFSVQLRKGLRP